MENPVGAEYILTEPSQGVELGKLWDDMSWKDRLEIVTTLVGYDKVFHSAEFPMYGSLYFAKDLHNPSPSQFLDGTNSTHAGENFAIGPTTNRAFFDEGRDAVEVNRGPCTFPCHHFTVCIKNSSHEQGPHSTITFILAPHESEPALTSSHTTQANKGFSAVQTNTNQPKPSRPKFSRII